ncbi:hypothetical protein [Hymenobacter algoricola]|uniref:Uncharacterized protein n=1 Tax=Hymenobacter algoricola TaxID=486267 RepID=A0ABP7NGB8_9BACT
MKKFVLKFAASCLLLAACSKQENPKPNATGTISHGVEAEGLRVEANRLVFQDENAFVATIHELGLKDDFQTREWEALLDV